MADLQLVVTYKPQALRPVYKGLNWLSWLSLIVIPFIWLSVLLALLVVPSLKVYLYSITTIVLFCAVLPYGLLLALGMMLSVPFRDCQMKISKDGMVLPMLLANRCKTRANHIWSEFTRATLRTDSNPLIADRVDGEIELTLDAGNPIVVELGGFERDELEQFLLAMEMWGTSLTRSPELIDFQTNLENANKGVERLSYTKIWEDELSRRFTATTFVPLEPGQTLRNGSLKIVRQLAFGGLSAIYLAQENDTDLRVVKEAFVPANAAAELRHMAEKHLAREAQLLAQLNHPNIARVLDHFVHDKRNYLVMEYIAGQDLRQLVRQHGPQEPRAVLEWAEQIASILSYLHNLDPPIIHRDLTPDNLVLKNDGSIMLIDFGASNQFVGTATGTLVGKQSYISPEQFRGKATCQSDIYAFGATIYFLLTGRDPVPLSACHPQEVLPSISEALDRLVASMTAPDAEARLKDSAEVMRRLSQVSESEMAVSS